MGSLDGPRTMSMRHTYTHTSARTHARGAAPSTALLAVLLSLCCLSPRGVSGAWHEDELDLASGVGTASAGRRLQENVQPSLSFVSFGDWGIAGKPADDVMQQMAAAAAANEAQFVMAIGDNFYPRGVKSVNDPLWKSVYEDRVGSHPSLNIPWYVVLGNHDHYGDAEAQIQFSGMQPSPDAGGRKWILPHYFWTTEKVVGTAKLQLVFIDTVLLDMDITRKTLEDKIGHGVVNESALADFDTNRPAREKHREEQLSWLEGILSASSADFLIVIGHYPVYSGGEHGSTPSLLTKLKPMLDKYRVDAYICGHDHTLQHLTSGGVSYYVNGQGALSGRVTALPETIFSTVDPGFAMHTVTEKSLTTTFINKEGTEIYSHVIQRSRSQYQDHQ